MSFACSSTDPPRRPLPEDPIRLLSAEGGALGQLLRAYPLDGDGYEALCRDLAAAARARRDGGEARGDN